MSDENKLTLTSKRVREAMDIRGMRQVDLVERTGLSKSLVNQYISGRVKNIGSDKITIIAKALSVNPIWLSGLDVPMELLEEKKLPLSPELAATIPELVTVVSGYPNAPAFVREAVLTLLKPYIDI